MIVLDTNVPWESMRPAPSPQDVEALGVTDPCTDDHPH